MLAHHAEAPVGVAWAMRLDAAAGLQEKRNRHVPSARLLDLAADLKRLVIVRDIVHIAGIDDCQRLVEHLCAAPRDHLVLSYAGLYHGSKNKRGLRGTRVRCILRCSLP